MPPRRMSSIGQHTPRTVLSAREESESDEEDAGVSHNFIFRQ